MKILSIIIPTRNRQKYCKAAIEQILSLDLRACEICIQDNSDDNTLGDYLQSKKYPDVIYNYHEGQLSFVDNFSEAISLASGKYLCMIGDDDGILSNIVNVVEWADKNNVDCVIPTVSSTFFWSNNDALAKNSSILYTDKIHKSIREVNVGNGLIKLLRNGGQNYLNLDIPRIYNGIVRREKLEEIKKTSGTLFDGLSPDIYIATALAFVCKRVYRIGFPFTLPGVCPRSGSADSATGKHTGDYKSAPHFKGHKEYEWDKKVPQIYSVETIWADSMLHAINRFGAIEYYDKFNICRLDGYCLLKYPQFKDVLKNHLCEFKCNYILCIMFAVIRREISRFSKLLYRLKRRARLTINNNMGKPTDVHVYKEVNDISEASKLVNQILVEQNCITI